MVMKIVFDDGEVLMDGISEEACFLVIPPGFGMTALIVDMDSEEIPQHSALCSALVRFLQEPENVGSVMRYAPRKKDPGHHHN